MVNFFKRPNLSIKVENPGWISGRQLTWLNLSIDGFCYLKLKSATHPLWKPVKLFCFSHFKSSYIVPLNSRITVVTWSFHGRQKQIFNVDSADWHTDTPKADDISNKFKEISNQKRLHVNKLKKEMSVLSNANLKLKTWKLHMNNSSNIKFIPKFKFNKPEQ